MSLYTSVTSIEKAKRYSKTINLMSTHHGINIPGTLLDELKAHDYTNDERFGAVTAGRGRNKRSARRQMSRKEARKQQRYEKKHKLHGKSKSMDEKFKRGERSLSLEDSASSDSEDDISLKIDKAEDIHAPVTTSKESKKSRPSGAISMRTDDELMERDQMEMEYYAKKLGLKGKKKKIHARDEFDAVGGLLEGLDFFENFGDEEIPEAENSEISSNNDDFSSEESDVESEPSQDETDEMNNSDDKKEKENPYIAPVQNGNTYMPPFLRKRQIEVQRESEESEEAAKLRKVVKSSLNKLSGSNITAVISALNNLYDTTPRQYVTDAITKEVLLIICQNNKLLDGLIKDYVGVLYSLWKLRGIEVGALFIQYFVETFLKYYDEQLELIHNNKKKGEEVLLVFPKQCSNLITLISYCYNFGFISCKLIYDLIRYFVESPNEFTAELLLRVVSISGPLIRSDDPSALKDIFSELLTNIKSIKDQPVRLRFLLETMSDLKNNRLKPSMLAISHQQLKKELQNFLKVSNSSNEPLQVAVEDIKSAHVKGKWWLVGASWRGNMDNALEGANDSHSGKPHSVSDTIDLKDDLLDNIADWSTIAKQQRMNTDVRRAIFVSIMSAQDYLDAFTRLEKLNLKNKQLIEIPNVLLHCLVQDGNENGYNSYYALLARKLCENQYNLSKGFRFLFWDTIKKFEDSIEDQDGEDDSSENFRLRSINTRGKFFGFLISEEILPLDVFKHVPLMSGLNGDGNLFMEVLLYQLLICIAKKSEIKSKNSEGKKVITRKEDRFYKLFNNGLKLENKSVILKSLKWFITKKFRYMDYFDNEKNNRNDEKELRRIEWAVPVFLHILDQELEHIDY